MNFEPTFSVILVLDGTLLMPAVPDVFDAPLCARIPDFAGAVLFPSFESVSILPVTLPREVAAPPSFCTGAEVCKLLK